jgi:2-polyprenyl-3-methyl-5-hydroxy-6-metoxy-1,4-benzoquinol methylase
MQPMLNKRDGVDRLTARECLLCGSTEHRAVFSEVETDILRCRRCRHVFSSATTKPHYDEYWSEEISAEDRAYFGEARNTMYEDFIRRFVRGGSGRLLDMGCGLGFFLKAMAPYGSWEAHGCEISPSAVRYARETLGLSNVICGHLDDVAGFQPGSFDVVTMWDVLDHLAQPEPVLKQCHRLLGSSGVCFIRTPNVVVQLARARLRRMVRGVEPGAAYLQARDHAHHYSMKSIRRILERSGFSRVEFIHLHPVDGHSTVVAGAAKRLTFEAIRAVALLSFGYVNLDNLFVVAHK